MIHTLIQPLFILVLFVLVYCAEVVINSARINVRSAIAYGIVGLLALIYVVLTLFGLS